MIYGTHNSLSYLKPRQWWLRPVAWIARCQDMTIEEQLMYGVRYFDIRVKFRNNIAISGHGLMDYDIPVYAVLREIQKHAENEASKNPYLEKVVVRILLEDRKGHRDRFREFVQNCMERFPLIQFTGGYRTRPYEQIVKLEETYEWHRYKLYSEPFAENWKECFRQLFKKRDAEELMKKIKGYAFPWPLYWAKRDNARYKTLPYIKLWDTIVLDFVQIK